MFQEPCIFTFRTRPVQWTNSWLYFVFMLWSPFRRLDPDRSSARWKMGWGEECQCNYYNAANDIPTFPPTISRPITSSQWLGCRGGGVETWSDRYVPCQIYRVLSQIKSRKQALVLRTGSYSNTLPSNPAKFHTSIKVLRELFVFNNKPDALIIQIYSVIKLYLFRASSPPIIRSSLLYIRHW
jgi:hypothetical protein